MSQRYATGRRLGYRDEAVTGMPGPLLDDYAAAAESWLARTIGGRKVAGNSKRDRGWDVIAAGWRIDVKWSSIEPGARMRRGDPLHPGLIVPAWKPRRAELYAAVFGETPERFDLFAWADGWATRAEVEAAVIMPGRTRKTSGLPAPFFFIGFDYLRRLDDPPKPK